MNDEAPTLSTKNKLKYKRKINFFYFILIKPQMLFFKNLRDFYYRNKIPSRPFDRQVADKIRRNVYFSVWTGVASLGKKMSASQKRIRFFFTCEKIKALMRQISHVEVCSEIRFFFQPHTTRKSLSVSNIRYLYSSLHSYNIHGCVVCLYDFYYLLVKVPL